MPMASAADIKASTIPPILRFVLLYRQHRSRLFVPLRLTPRLICYLGIHMNDASVLEFGIMCDKFGATHVSSITVMTTTQQLIQNNSFWNICSYIPPRLRLR
jgi:hypothetical protein